MADTHTTLVETLLSLVKQGYYVTFGFTSLAEAARVQDGVPPESYTISARKAGGADYKRIVIPRMLILTEYGKGSAELERLIVSYLHDV